MRFITPDIQRFAEVFQCYSFSQASDGLSRLLKTDTSPTRRIEALSLLFRINLEKDDPLELDEMCRTATKLLGQATEKGLVGALYHFGILFLLSEEPERAREAFQSAIRLSSSQAEKLHARYGLSTVWHNQGESQTALRDLDELLPLIEASEDPSLLCLVHLMRGNCFRGLGDYRAALTAYQDAQGLLSQTSIFYLKNWVFFGLAVSRARLGEIELARNLFDICLSITNPVDFRRLHRLAESELSRIAGEAHVIFDPVTGDLTTQKGFLTLRKKGTLIRLMSELIRHHPEPISKENLYLIIWSAEYHPLRHDGLIYAHVQRLRQFLSADATLSDWIVTAPHGYRLDPNIRVRLKEANHESTTNDSYPRHVAPMGR